MQNENNVAQALRKLGAALLELADALDPEATETPTGVSKGIDLASCFTLTDRPDPVKVSLQWCVADALYRKLVTLGVITLPAMASMQVHEFKSLQVNFTGPGGDLHLNPIRRIMAMHGLSFPSDEPGNRMVAEYDTVRNLIASSFPYLPDGVARLSTWDFLPVLGINGVFDADTLGAFFDPKKPARKSSGWGPYRQQVLDNRLACLGLRYL